MRRIVAGLLLLGVLAGCSDDSPDREPRADPTTQVPTTAPGQPARPASRPKVGSCYRMSYEAALAPTSTHRPVRCARPHSAQTYYVGELDLFRDEVLPRLEARGLRET